MNTPCFRNHSNNNMEMIPHHLLNAPKKTLLNKNLTFKKEQLNTTFSSPKIRKLDFSYSS